MRNKVSELREMLYDMAKADQGRRFHSVYDKVCREDVLEEAWKSVRANRGSPGIDSVTIEDIEKRGVDEFLRNIGKELRERGFTPSPLRRVWIPKANGKKRGLGIPTVKDRTVQSAIRIVIEPIFESQFESNSYGFRPNKSAHDAVDEIVKYLNYGCEMVIDADISGCFDNIDRDRLMQQIALRISDGALLHLIRVFIDAGTMEGEEMTMPEKGTPQGSPLSPLLANIFLDQLDKKWKKPGLWRRENARIIRYADDLVVLIGGNPEEPMRKLRNIITEIGLQPNEEKTRLTEAESGFDFLGFRLTRTYSRRRKKRVTRWFPSPKSEKSIRARILETTALRHLSNTTPEEARDELIPILRGWGNYFAHSLASGVFNGVWSYAQNRLMYMYCRQHNTRSKWRYSDIQKLGFTLLKHKPSSYLGRSHNAKS